MSFGVPVEIETVPTTTSFVRHQLLKPFKQVEGKEFDANYHHAIEHAWFHLIPMLGYVNLEQFEQIEKPVQPQPADEFRKKFAMRRKHGANPAAVEATCFFEFVPTLDNSAVKLAIYVGIPDSQLTQSDSKEEHPVRKKFSSEYAKHRGWVSGAFLEGLGTEKTTDMTGYVAQLAALKSLYPDLPVLKKHFLSNHDQWLSTAHIERVAADNQLWSDMHENKDYRSGFKWDAEHYLKAFQDLEKQNREVPQKDHLDFCQMNYDDLTSVKKREYLQLVNTSLKEKPNDRQQVYQAISERKYAQSSWTENFKANWKALTWGAMFGVIPIFMCFGKHDYTASRNLEDLVFPNKNEKNNPQANPKPSQAPMQVPPPNDRAVTEVTVAWQHSEKKHDDAEVHKNSLGFHHAAVASITITHDTAVSRAPAASDSDEDEEKIEGLVDVPLNLPGIAHAAHP